MAVTVSIVLVAAGISMCQMSYIDQQMIYFPDKELIATPADVGLEYEDVDLTASDGTKIHGWHVPGEGRITLLWFHGNAGNISHRVDNILMLNRTLGVNIMIIDYRGYGRSQGKPSEDGLYQDAEAAIEFLVSQRGVSQETELVLFGRSLGAGVAVEMAVRHRARAVILESGFTSVRDMAQRA
ncbi:MAG: alpha/beta hydrolase, partial [Chloroflexi bacterium]|nr:alpha/beta hydrolase [Chloroflexota bacterium]